MDAAHEMSRHRGREGTLRKVVERYWWPVMYVNVMDWVKTYKQCEKSAPLRYDEPLKRLTVSHLWQRVGMDISYMPKMEDGYHPLVVARKYLSGWAEARPLTQDTLEEVADCFDKEVICRFRTTGQCGCRRRSREQDMDRPPPHMLQYPEYHRNPIPCRRCWSN